MKKSIKCLFLGLGLFVFCSCANTNSIEIKAEDTTSTTETEPVVVKPCQVVIEKAEHGEITTDISEGEIGEIVTVTAKHDLLYKISNVSVNGTALVESEETSGLYSFALVEGENKITATFIIDEELCGELTTIVQEASDKDWTNLFTVENVVTIVKWLLDCGILIAVVRYFVKDKKLASKIEDKVTEVTQQIVPDATKQAVLENTKTIIEPMFNQVVQDGVAARQLMSTMVKCMVLMQQNTPESKVAILDEFEKIKGVADSDTIASVKKYIQDAVEAHDKAYQETLAKIESISKQHQENVDTTEKSENEVVEEEKDNGTQI